MIKIRVPATSANLGPGFDVFGLALKSEETNTASSNSKVIDAFLELQVQTLPGKSPSVLNCEITCEGEGADVLKKQLPNENLITRVALYVLRCHGHHEFPSFTKVRIINGIPLSRGLGSSAAATVAGVLLGNEVGDLGLSRNRMFDYALMVEIQNHPDNVAAALFGGFVSTIMKTLSPEDTARVLELAKAGSTVERFD
ncbi:homoserine kinase, partial [Lecanoromycetidae sp. Uapishka_2]